MRALVPLMVVLILGPQLGPLALADVRSSDPDLVPVKPMRTARTAYKQLTNGWNSPTGGSAPRYDNYGAGINSAPPTLPATAQQPQQSFVGGMQEAGGALVDATKSGLEETGNRLEKAGQNLGEAVNELSGGTLGRMNTEIRESFDEWTGGNQQPRQGYVPYSYNQNTPANYQTQPGQPANGRPVSPVAGANQTPGSLNLPPPPSIPGNRSAVNGGFTAPPLSTQSTPARQLQDPGANPYTNPRQNSSTIGNPRLPASYNNRTQPPTRQEQSVLVNSGSGTTPRSNQPTQLQNPERDSGMVNVAPLGTSPFRTEGNYRSNNASNPQRGSSEVGSGSFVMEEVATVTADENQSNNRPFSNLSGNGFSNNGQNVGNQMQNRGIGNYPPQNTNLAAQTNGNFNAGYRPPVNPQAPASNEENQLPKEKPWALMVLTGLSLVGSIAANLFLGFGYLDARHKYLSAVRRGSRSFARDEAA